MWRNVLRLINALRLMLMAVFPLGVIQHSLAVAQREARCTGTQKITHSLFECFAFELSGAGDADAGRQKRSVITTSPMGSCPPRGKGSWVPLPIATNMAIT